MRIYAIPVLVISSFILHVHGYLYSISSIKRRHRHEDNWLKRTSHVHIRQGPLFCTAVDGILAMNVLSEKVKEYMIIRGDNGASYIIPNATIVTKNRDGRETKKENALEFVKPSGWFKDEFALDLKARADDSIPKVSHPLSNIELSKYGFGDLTETIIYYGGAYNVGEQLDIGWVEPDIPKEIWEEQLRPVQTKTYNLGITGSLRLGAALEDDLALAEGLDLGEVKQQREEKMMQNFTVSTSSVFSMESAPSYDTTLKLKPVMPVIDKQQERIRSEERFTLNTLQRVNLGVVCLLNALAWGRATEDIITNNIWGDNSAVIADAVKVIAIVGLLVDGGSAAVSSLTARSKNRNQGTWLTKGLLGGVFAIKELKSLSDLSDVTAVGNSTASTPTVTPVQNKTTIEQ